jgi:ketosteroid isomerase-like protein
MPEDVEIVRAVLRAYVDHDVPRVLEALDPAVELYPIRAVFEGTPYRGHEGFRRFIADMREDWRESTIEADEVRDMGGGRVLVAGRFRGQGASGVEVDTPAVWVCEVRDGKIVRLRFYADEAAAIQATGETAP